MQKESKWLNENFSVNLKCVMDKQQITRRKLAELINKDYQVVTSYVTGRNLPPLNTACDIALNLGVSIDYLCHDCNVNNHIHPLRGVSVSKQLQSLYELITALGMNIRITDKGVILESENQYLKSYFEQVQAAPAKVSAIAKLYDQLELTEDGIGFNEED